MKTQLSNLMSTGALFALTFGIHAADRTEPDRARDYQGGRVSQSERLGHVVKASDVIGSDVKNLQDETLGKVSELAVDVETGRIVQVLVSSGGILGIGDKVVAVPPTAFTCDTPHPTLRLDATKEKVKGAPGFEVSKWDELTQTNRLTEGYRYFGKEPYFANRARNNDLKSSTPMPTRIEKASKVIGAAVKSGADEKLGKVDDLMVDVEAGRIVQVVLSSGGFLGVGDDLTAIPPAAFQYNEADHTLVVKATKDAVTKAPRFKKSEWPNFSDPVYSSSVYRTYQVEPYFSADADNTRRNVRDRNDGQLTPLDQGTSEADVDTTRRIRKEILDQQNLSVNARNIKVITANGRVTLRGPVNSAAERRTIEEIAQRIAPAAKVENQLEVKQPAER